MVLHRNCSMKLCVDLQRWRNFNQFCFGSRRNRCILYLFGSQRDASLSHRRDIYWREHLSNRKWFVFGSMQQLQHIHFGCESCFQSTTWTQHLSILCARNQVCSKRQSSRLINLIVCTCSMCSPAHSTFNIQWQFIKIIRQKFVADVDRARTRLLDNFCFAFVVLERFVLAFKHRMLS